MELFFYFQLVSVVLDFVIYLPARFIMFDKTGVHPVKTIMPPLVTVFSCCSWPAASTRVKLQTKFCISLTPQAVIGGGLHTLGSVVAVLLSIPYTRFLAGLN